MKICETCKQIIKDDIKPRIVTCNRCNHSWSTKLKRPMQCTLCKSLRWDKKVFQNKEEITEDGEIWKMVDGGEYYISSLEKLWNIKRNRLEENKQKKAEKLYTIYFGLR